MTRNTTDETLAHARLTSLRDPGGIKVNDEVRSLFPAVFNTRPAIHLSDQYQFYPSFKIIEDMDKLGMRLVQIGQQRSQKRNPATQLHVMRFQAGAQAQRIGDSSLEMVIMNGHDGRNKMRAWAGIFRLVCLNGMVISDLDLGNIKQRHYGAKNSFPTIEAMLADLSGSVALIADKVNVWQKSFLDEAAQERLARACMEARKMPDWLEPDQLLAARRPEEDAGEDGKRSIWTTFNVIQENVMKGGIDKTGPGRDTSTRPVSGAFSDVATNVALWEKLSQFSVDIGVTQPYVEKQLETA